MWWQMSWIVVHVPRCWRDPGNYQWQRHSLRIGRSSVGGSTDHWNSFSHRKNKVRWSTTGLKFSQLHFPKIYQTLSKFRQSTSQNLQLFWWQNREQKIFQAASAEAPVPTHFSADELGKVRPQLSSRWRPKGFGCGVQRDRRKHKNTTCTEYIIVNYI